MPFWGENRAFLLKAKKGKEQQKTKTKKIRRVQGQVRWPEGPPHLTLKPSKKNPKKQKRKKHKQKKTKRKERKSKKTQKYQKKSFSIISQNFLFLGGGVQKLPFLTTWPRKRAPPKRYKNRGFNLFF